MDQKVIDFLVSHFEDKEAPDKYKQIIDNIGIDSTVKLCVLTNGDELYFPKPESVLRNTRNKVIRQEYRNGSTHKELSFKYELTCKQIDKILLSE